MKPNKILKRILFPILNPISKIYTSKERKYKYIDISVKILPGVFHPGLFFTTKFLLDYLGDKNLSGKNFLELGCGTGIISILASKSGAIVTASDINRKAIENTKLNAGISNTEVKLILSDLFEKIPLQKFKWIVVNPPFYPKDAKDEVEQAFFCGSDFQFFRKFFSQIGSYIDSDSNVTMILSEDCDIQKITSIANENNFILEEIERKKIWLEWIFLYNILTKN